MTTYRSRRRRLMVLAGLAALPVMFAAGVLLALVGRPAPPDPHATVTVDEQASGSRASGPVPSADGTEAEAVAAALRIASLPQDWLYLTDAQLHDAVTDVATPAYAVTFEVDVAGRVGTARPLLQQATGPVWWLVRPLASKVVSVAGDRAVIAVWTVSVLSAADVVVPQSTWTTTTFSLQWVAGRWRVDGMRDQPGPTPTVAATDKPWLPEQLDLALTGFQRVGGDPK